MNGTRGFRSRSEFDSRGWYLAGLAARADLTYTDATAMRKSLNDRVYAALAANPRTPLTILDSLFRLQSRAVRLGLAANPAVDRNALIDHTLATWNPGPRNGHYGSIGEVFAVLLRDRPLTEADRAAILTRICSRLTRVHPIAGVPEYVLFIDSLIGWSRGLPGDVFDWIARQLINEPTDAVPQGHLPHDKVRHTIRALLNPRHPLSPDTLSWLYRECDVQIRPDTWWETGWLQAISEHILQHPACPPDILTAACNHFLKDMRSTAARHPNCPDEGRVAAALLDRATA